MKVSNPGGGDALGASVALSADGSSPAVGPPGERSSASGLNGTPVDHSAGSSGDVSVFTR